MNGMIRVLVVLLCIQIGVTAFYALQDDELATFVPDEPFIRADISELSKIVIENRENDETISLVKSGDRWVLESHYGFPVSAAKIDSIEKQLLQIKRPFAVGSTLIAAKQFEATEDTFKQKVSLYREGEEPIETIYFGTSPGFKKVHARKAGEDATFAISYSSYDLQTNQSSWVDRDFLKISRDQIDRIRFADIDLAIDDANQVTLADLKEDEELVDKEVDSFINLVSRPPFSGVVGTEVKPEHNLSEPDIEYVIDTHNGESLHFKLAKGESDDKVYLTRSDVPYVFEVTKFHFENLQKQRREALVKEKETPAEPTGEVESDELSTQSDSASGNAAPGSEDGEAALSSPAPTAQEE